MKRWSSMSVETETVLRALAISAIVFNHASPAQSEDSFGLGGGLTFLIMLSGFNLARYSLQGASSAAFRQSVLLLGWRVAWPTVLIVLLDWAVTGERPALGYLLFYSNWFTWHHPALLQIWYPQMLIKLLLIFWVLFHFEPLARLVRRKPFRVFFFAFLLAVAIRAIAPDWLEPPETRGRLVHFYAWNFLLGMLAYYALQSGAGRGPLMKRAIVIACAVTGAFVAYGPFKSDFWWLSVATAVWVSFPRSSLPPIVGRTVRVVSQAAFAVFLLHLFFLYVWWKANLPYEPVLQFAFSLGGSVAVWVVMTALSRAYRAERSAAPNAAQVPAVREAAA